MHYVALYVVTAVVFLAMDVVMLKKVLYPMFSSNIGSIMREDTNMGVAAVFYLFYVGGVLWFASIPALSSGHTIQAFVSGFLLGLLAYGTYEFTNFATLKGWSTQMVMVDLIWGGILTGTSALTGVLVVKTLFKAV